MSSETTRKGKRGQRNSDQKIAINLFPLEKSSFEFSVFRRKASGNESLENCKRYKLPVSNDGEGNQVAEYWVSFGGKQPDEFSSFTVNSHRNRYLTTAYLFECLVRRSESSGIENFVFRGFNSRIAFVMETHPQGKSCIVVSPYFCHATRSFGFLTDFWFKKKKGQPLDKEVLRLSHTMNERYRENTDFYSTRYESLQQFQTKIYGSVFPLEDSDGQEIRLRRVLQNVESRLLKTKRYLAGSSRPATSQFIALKNNGPFRRVADNAKICFLYMPDDKPLSHDLYKALRGDTYPTFDGMESMFGFSLGREHVFGLPIEGYSHDQIKRAANQISEKAGNDLVVPVMLVPWSRHDSDSESNDQYYVSKHAFLSSGLPSQYVCTKTIRNRNSFKWTVSNIGMAIFAKLGGKPWKVVTEDEPCLIVGIGQSHRRNENDQIIRYYSYCVLTDSSGVYEDLRLLSHDKSEKDYLNGLTKSLVKVFREHSENFNRFAIHTPFKLQKKEMAAVQKAINQFSTESETPPTFAVLKFNTSSRFMGFATNTNSRVPYESTLVPLSRSESLVWFEGLQFHKRTVDRRYSKPVHVEFTFPTVDPETGNEILSESDKEGFLQDSLCLSGANWRGFNAKSRPVSIFYAQLIAKYFCEFERLGLEEFDIENLTPWFL